MDDAINRDLRGELRPNPIDYDKLRQVTRGEVDALRTDLVQLRIRLDALATNAELAGFHGLNLAALLTQCLPYVSAANTAHAVNLGDRVRAALGVE